MKKKQNTLFSIQLSNLFINGRMFEGVASLKFLGTIFDKNIPWDPHIPLTENKVSKNTGVFCNKKHIPTLFAFIHN